MKNTELSLVVIARNESRCIARCLKSAKPFVTRMVVLDTGSTDETVAIAQACGAEVFHFQWCDDFAAARNASLAYANADWNLVLDADEWLESGGDVIRSFISGVPRIGIVTQANHFSVDGMESENQIWIPRLLPRGVLYTGRIHEQPVAQLPRVRLPIVIKHDGYLPEQLEKKRDRNQTLLLEELSENPEDPYLLFQLGKDYEVYGDFVQAAEYYSQSLDRVDTLAVYHHSLSVRFLFCLSQSGQLEEAIIRSQVMTEQWPDSPDLFFTIGNLMLDFAIQNPQEAYSQWLPMAESAWLRCLEIGERPDLDGSVVGRGSFLAAGNLAVIYAGMQNQAKADYYQQLAVSLKGA